MSIACPEVQNLLRLRMGPEIVDLGGPNGPLPPKIPRGRSHPFPLVLGRQGPLGPPNSAIPGPTLKIIDLGPLGIEYIFSATCNSKPLALFNLALFLCVPVLASGQPQLLSVGMLALAVCPSANAVADLVVRLYPGP